MTDKPKQPKPNQDEPVGDTRRLEKATEELAASAIEGTLMSIEAHTGEHPIPEEDPSVTDSLKRAKGGGALPATMYGPTKPGQAKVGSTAATQFGPTDAGRPPGGNAPMPGSGPGTMHSAGGTGGRAIAPFGGKIMVGTRVGQIEVTGVLGKGGMGEVFRGYHHALDIQVAIKVLPDELSRNELVRQRFLREARLCVKLDHPNIVRVYNVDEHAGNLFLVMEIIEGTDAANMLKNGGRFKYRRALEIGAACADALGYAHTQGLVHRDVKPHNILLGRDDGKIKLSDFGLARAATSSSHLTMSGQIMGTPHYMSPEQAESKEVTDKADVYSLGVTMYHMLTGETPFVGDTPISVAVQHIAKEILYPEARFAAFPKELVAVLKRMTAKDASKRCNAKQAAVWLRKLVSMAPTEDIQVAADAMQTLAPVVRESQAFEAAAKQREEQDERAREAARTMIATIQERAPIPPTQAQTPAPSQPHITPMPQKKSGGVAAAAAVLLLLGGGGAAAWWFTMGPGAQGSNNAPMVAGENGTRNPADNRGTIGVNPPANSGPSGNAAGNEQPAGNNSSNAPANNTQLPPPPLEEDKAINTQLEAAIASFGQTDTLEDLAKAKAKLDQVEVERGRASERQRKQLDDLQARYKRQFVLLSGREQVGMVRTAIADFRKLRDSDMGKAVIALNRAVASRDNLAALDVPVEVEPLIRDDITAATKDVDSEIAGLDKLISDAAKGFEDKKLYDKAEEQLRFLLAVKLPATRQMELQSRVLECQVRGKHAAIASKLELAAKDDKQYTEADKLLAELDKTGVPEALKPAHVLITKSVKDAVAARFAALLALAQKSADAGDFAVGRGQQDTASQLPLSNDQTVKLADEAFFLGLKEQLYLADKAVTEDQLMEAKSKLDEAKSRIDAPGQRSIPVGLTQRYDTVRGRFDAQLSQKFENLLAAAEANMKEKNFKGASDSIVEASKLPLTRGQKDRLDDFNDANEQALADFAKELIETVETALNAGNFEAAWSALEKANAMNIPEDSQKKLVTLQARFSAEAIKRHTELLDAAETSLKDKRYETAQKALDDARKVPVEDTRRAREKSLKESYATTLTDDVTARLKSADQLMDESKFKEARAVVDGALSLPLDDTLRQKVRNKNDALDARVDTALAELLAASSKACESRQYDVSSKKLAEVDAFRDILTRNQLDRLTSAQDAHKKSLSAYTEDLFKQLQKAVDTGDEASGKKVVALLEAMPLGFVDRDKLKNLSAALSGETEAARLARMPDFLKKLSGDRYFKTEQLIKVGEAITAVNASADGKFGAVGTESGKVIFYNLKRGTQLGQSVSGRRKVTSIAINSTGTVAVAGNDDGALVLFNPGDSTKGATTLESVNDVVNGIQFSPDGKVLFVLTRKGNIVRYNAENKSMLGSTPTGIDRAMAFAISPDGQYLAAGGRDAKIAVFEIGRMVLRETLEGPGDDQIQSVGFSADSRMLFAGSIGDDVALWEMQRLTKKPLRQFKGLSEWVRGTGFSADGKRVCALDNEKRLMIWDAGSKTQELKRLEFSQLSEKGKDITVDTAWISPDGTVLIGTREGNLIHLTVKSAG